MVFSPFQKVYQNGSFHGGKNFEFASIYCFMFWFYINFNELGVNDGP